MGTCLWGCTIRMWRKVVQTSSTGSEGLRGPVAQYDRMRRDVQLETSGNCQTFAQMDGGLHAPPDALSKRHLGVMRMKRVFLDQGLYCNLVLNVIVNWMT